MSRFLHILALGLVLGSLPLVAADPCRDNLKKVAPVDLVWGQDDRLHFVMKGGDTPMKRTLGAIATTMAGPFWLNAMSKAIAKASHNAKELSAPDKMLEALGIAYQASGAVNEIPKTGGMLVVANHPRFGAEGLAIASLLAKQRPDVKIVLNKMNQTVPGFEEISFAVDMDGDVKANVRSLKEMKQWLAEGHVVLIFPAGAISKYSGLPNSQDGDWNRTTAFLAKSAKVPVLPIHSDDAKPSLFFRMAETRLPKKMMKSTYPQEILRQRGSTVDLNVGQLIPPETLKEFESDEAATQYLRDQTYALRPTP